MPHRPSPADFDKPLITAQIEEFRAQVRKMASYELKKEYQRAYELCRMDSERLPAARSIQELVTVWRIMWDAARRRRPTRD